MNSTNRRLQLAVTLLTLLHFAPSTTAQDPHWDAYNDPVQFEKLSSATQNLLIAKFGQPPRFDEKGNPLPPIPAVTAPPRPGKGLKRGSLQPRPRGPLDVLGNVLVNDPKADLTAQDTQSETALVLGAGSNLIAGFNDSGSFIGANHFTGWAYSSDGGQSWIDPGVLPGSDDAGDPVLARDNTTGRTYFACLSFAGVGINIFRSDNDGVTWMPAVNGAPGSSGFQDKEWIAVDNFPGPGNGNVYHVSRDFGSGNGIFFYRSTNQGSTFGPLGGILIASGSPSNVQGAYVVVGTNHDVYAFWYDSNFAPAQIRMRKSIDQGLTFGAPLTVTTLTSTAVNGNLSLVAGFRSNSFAQVVVNPVSGNLYAAYNNPAAPSGGDRGNIFLRQSTDGGANWSAPILINDDGTARAQYFPALACRPDGTGLAVCWYDNRSHAADINMERWGVTATISGSTLTFGPNFRITAQFPPVFGVDPVVNSVYMGDYDMMAADNTSYYTTWGDNRDDSLAVPSRKNANVRFTSFGQSGPGAFLDLDSVVVTGGNGNGRIEFNECNELVVTLRNNGAEAANSIASILSTLTPGVTIVDPAQAYPDLPAGEAGSATFEVSTSPAFACGATIHFTLSVSHSGGPQVLEFDLTTGGAEYVITAGVDSIVAGVTDIGNHGDDVTTTIALPFPVTFYNASFSSATFSSNGNVQFTGASASFSNVCFPTTFLSNVIAPQWDDLRTDAAGSGIFIRTTGVTPNRVFHAEWRTTYFSFPGTANFELRLHEGSSSFEIVYGVVTQNSAGATIGCQKDTGSSFTSHSCDTAGSVSFGTMLSFALPGCPDGGGECITCEIVCPGDILQDSDPDQCGAIVDYPTPTTTAGCGIVTCTPPSGSFFPLGTTTVFCSTEAGPTCSFDVTVDEGQVCVVLDFQSEDDFATALFNGQTISTPPEFGNLVAIGSSGPNAGAAIFDSTPGGPNDPSQDRDLLVGSGLVLMLQTTDNTTQTVPGTFDRPNDEEDGGTLSFSFATPALLQSLDLIDIDTGADESSSVILTDALGRTRIYSIPAGWTGDLLLGQPGILTLDLTTLATQPGFASTATASQDPSFDAEHVMTLEVHLGSSGAVDNLAWCRSGC
ncbi:MAG: hypothetical protein HOP15_10635 [Planctomycetes bacterium]|nr:hypothetical protein [Planctomycetota bacterium]